MTCHEIDGFLDGPLAPSEWPAEARQHVATCPRCQVLVQALDEFVSTPASEATLAEAVTGRMLAGIKPVRPLPSLWAAAIRLGVCAAAIGTLAALATGAKGWAVLRPGQRGVIFSVAFAVLAVQAVFAGAEMEPGRGRPLAGRWLRWLIPASLLSLPVLLFQWSPDATFLSHWAGCFGRAVITTIAVFAGVWIWARRGYFVDSARAGATLGLLSGLGGFLSQELYCPVLETAHVAISHVGLVVFATLAGALVGRAARSR